MIELVFLKARRLHLVLERAWFIMEVRLCDLQDGDSAQKPYPDSTAVNQKAPMASDKKGEPLMGKVRSDANVVLDVTRCNTFCFSGFTQSAGDWQVSTPDGEDHDSPKVSTPDIETDDVVRHLGLTTPDI